MLAESIEIELIGLINEIIEYLLDEKGIKIDPAKFPRPALEMPKIKEHGDLSCNAAFVLSKLAGLNPMEMAAAIKDEFNKRLPESRLDGQVFDAEVKSGFINFRLKEKFLYKVLKEIYALSDKYGRLGQENGRSIQVEFVSANPTGPLTIAHGRQAAVGDALANILEFCGYKVVREYYLNDEGRQIETLGASLKARYLQLQGFPLELPQDGYRGEYITDIARSLADERGKGLADEKEKLPKGFFSEYCYKAILKGIEKDLKDFGVVFDVWYSQRSLGEKGKIKQGIDILRKKGLVFEQDGAVWFNSTKYGDDKDRVLVKSDGSLTYITSDIAYHLEKYKRGFDEIIDIWGPDHHGYIPRVKAAIEALGYDKNTLRVIIVQLATLYRNGQPVSMSTRAGEFVTLRELMDEVGKDAARFFFLLRKTDTHLDFDLELAKKESSDNPVYYVQYAHARIESVLQFHKNELAPKIPKGGIDLASGILSKPEEIDLIKYLYQFPGAVRQSAAALEPHRLVAYSKELAAVFHRFYTEHRIVTDDPQLTAARLYLISCTKIVLANCLNLLGVSCPEKM